MTNFDLVIRGGTVFDGTGAVPTTADVGVRDGKVAAIAHGLPEGARTVDGSSAAEAPYPGAPSVKRMVNRNDALVRATIVGGQIVYTEGEFAPGFGSELQAGRFLEAANR
jgi:N-acyl-D-aspartate/D-glutamate deacylase